MHPSRLALIVGLFCCSTVLAAAKDEAPSESEPPCDVETDESCVIENDDVDGESIEGEEELDRGFDPCLVNASLPACKPANDVEETTEAKHSESESEEVTATADEDGDSR